MVACESARVGDIFENSVGVDPCAQFISKEVKHGSHHIDQQSPQYDQDGTCLYATRRDKVAARTFQLTLSVDENDLAIASIHVGRQLLKANQSTPRLGFAPAL